MKKFEVYYEKWVNPSDNCAEEKEVIESIEFSLRFYKQMVVDALEDGVITDKEHHMLEGMKERIIKEGFNIAEAINGVSKDEMNLLISVMLSLKLPSVANKELID